MHEHQAHLKALGTGEAFVPTLKKSKSSVNNKKRKNTGKSQQGSPKRRRSASSDDDDVDELMESDEDFSDNTDSDVDDDGGSTKASDEDPESSESEDEEVAELTEGDLKEKIQKAKDAIKSGREMLNDARTAKKETIDALSYVEKGSVKIQREKNAFCSLKRSEVSRNFEFSRQQHID